MYSNGMDYRQKNKARRLDAAGVPLEHISHELRVKPDVIERYLGHINPSPEQDEYGPLPGSAQWDELSPGAKSGLTRKRNYLHA